MTAATNLSAPPVLEMRDITKTFPGVKALSGVHLSVRPGEIHALMGENGAGKSTLMKILAGAYGADSGQIFINGQEAHINGPLEARRLGVNLIYQELNLSPNLTVAENIFMGSEPTLGPLGMVDRRRARREAQAVLTSLGAPFTPDTPVSSLSIAEKQQVEIARALHFKSKVLVMDEPTAALSERETQALFGLIKQLRASGIAIVYITHRMAEVYELADRVTVLRDGQYVGTLERSEISAERLVSLMVGRPLTDFYKREAVNSVGDVVLDVRGLHGGKVKPCSFTVRAGEILGLSGLVGAGRTELARLIFAADHAKGGQVFLDGRLLRVNSPTEAIRAGVGYLPENRKEQGLFLDMGVRDNITMSVLDVNAHGGFIDDARLNTLGHDMVQNLNIRVPHLQSLAHGLSGGNQQKLLVARWLAIRPRVLLLDEPTRGVDVGAKAEIYRIIAELGRQGVAVVFISSELPEIVGMCDRVLVMREGELVGELDPARGDKITQENVMHLATGAAEVRA